MTDEAPGKSGMALGAKALHLAGVQGGSRVFALVVQVGSMLAIAAVLGPADLGAYALLMFVASVVNQVLGVAVRPGMLRRTFGETEDEDGGDDFSGADGEEGGGADDLVSASPTRSLGTGLVFASILGLLAIVLVTAFAEPLEDLLLGDYGSGTVAMVAWAGILGAAFTVAKLAGISLWFEHRTNASVATEIVQPTVALGLLILFLSLDFGVTGALAAAAIGAAVSAVLGLVLLWGSFAVCLDRKEIGEILRVGRLKAPILMSLWFTQAADIVFVSRFVDPASVGVYNFGARLGGASAILPRGLRLALRPLRKTALFPAARDQYGKSILDGLILTYFLLMGIVVVFLMVLIAPLAAALAPTGFEDIGPLIPLSAAAAAMPVLIRTVYGSVAWPGKSQRALVVAAVGSAVGFLVLNIVLGPSLGIYAPPVSGLVAFGVACAVLLIKGQTSRKRIDIHWIELLKAVVFAAVIGAAFLFVVPDKLWAEAVCAAIAALLFFSVVIYGGAVPRQHRAAWRSILRFGVQGGRGVEDFDPRLGLTALSRRERNFLHRAIVGALSPSRLAAQRVMSGLDYKDLELPLGLHLMSCLRRVAVVGGVGMVDVSAETGDNDALIAEFLFGNEPLAVRQATMRKALEMGESPATMNSLEAVKKSLARLPSDDWN